MLGQCTCKTLLKLECIEEHYDFTTKNRLYEFAIRTTLVREHGASAQNAGKQILHRGMLGVGTKLPSNNLTIALQHRENRNVLRHPIALSIIPFSAPTNVACRFECMINAQHITR